MTRFFFRGALAFSVVTALALGPAVAPAVAHSGGRAVVLVRDLSLAPTGSTWMATATLVDSDTGTPIQADVKALAGSPATIFDLEPATALGTYTGRVDGLAAGPAQLELKVRTQAGYDGVVPFDRVYPFELVAGQPVQIASGGGGGGSNAPLIGGVAVAVLAVALLYGLYSLRRRTARPVQGE